MSKMNFLVLGMVLFLAVTVSANLAVVGTIGDSNGVLSGAEVSFVCDGNLRNDFSDSDGDYSIIFTDSECEEFDVINFVVMKSGYNVFSGTPKVLNFSETARLGDSYGMFYFIQFDATLTKIVSGGSSSGGSSGGRVCRTEFWDCNSSVWSECVDGSQSRTCVSNCAVSRLETQSCNVSANGDDFGTSEFIAEDESGVNKFFSTITGAVIGGGRTAWSAGIIFVLLVVGGFGFVRYRKGKK